MVSVSWIKMAAQLLPSHVQFRRKEMKEEGVGKKGMKYKEEGKTEEKGGHASSP